MKKIDYASMFTLRKDGRYQGSYTDDKGRHYVYDRDPEKLWHKLNDPKVEKSVTFKDIAEQWKNRTWDRISEGTKASYQACYDRAVKEFADTPAVEIETHQIRNHLERMRQQGYSASTMKAQKLIYNSIFRDAITDEITGKVLRINPVTEIRIPKSLKPPKTREAPEDEIVAKVRESAATDPFGLFPLLLMSTGFRRGEGLAVRWNNIDFRGKNIAQDKQIVYRGTVIEKEPKTKYGDRIVPLLPDLERVLHRPKGAKDTDFVFHGEDPGKPMCEATYRRRWLSYCKRMGFVTDTPEEYKGKNGHTYIRHHYKPTLTAHVLRHGYATMLFEAGVDEFTAQRLLGHANISTTRVIYTHLRNKKKQESIEKLRDYVRCQIENDVINDVKSVK